MFKEETVFILGAGASWHYGYPTGEELVERTIQKAKKIAEFIKEDQALANYWAVNNCPDYLRSKFEGNPSSHIFLPDAKDIRWALNTVQEECIALATALRSVKPIVIDNFLGQNPSLEPIGKFIVSWVILECEHKYYDTAQRGRKNVNQNSLSAQNDITNLKDDWCRFIVHRLAQKPKELLSNNVTFVTFNYDISLETSLYRSLQYIESFNKPDIENFIESDRFLHIYGRIHNQFKKEHLTLKTLEEGLPKEEDRAVYFKKHLLIFNKVYECSKNIFTMEDCETTIGDKNKCEEITKKACEKIASAKHVYILGYGFDERNSKRLKLKEALRDTSSNHKKIYFTNFGDKNIINKKASKLFFDVPQRFLPPTYIQSIDTRPTTMRSYYEKSIKNVYEALEEDFDFLMIDNED